MTARLTGPQSEVLAVIDSQLERINKVLTKVQPYIDERDRLMRVRRTLLSEKALTGGAGGDGARMSMEEVVTFLREHGPSTPSEISEGLGFDSPRVRSHLSRGRGERYWNENGKWGLIGEQEA